MGTNWVFGYAHNGILEIWLQLGAVGVGLFFVTFFKRQRMRGFAFVMIVPLAFSGISDSLC